MKDANAAAREETVNGEAAVLYSVHQTVDGTMIDSQVWISKARGLPLKTELDMDVGGKLGKTHRSMRYEYTNVRASGGRTLGLFVRPKAVRTRQLGSTDR